MCARSGGLESGEAGFSLLEAIVSLAILALALAATFGSGMTGVRLTSRGAERTEALLEARSLIDRVGVDMPLVPGRYEGTTEAGRGYRLIISPEASTSRTLQAYRVEAAMLSRNGTTPLLSLRTLRTAEAP